MIWAGAQHREGGFFGRLHDEVLPATIAGANLERHQHHRDVPWNDGTDDAKWLADSERQHVGAERNGLALELRTEPAEERIRPQELKPLFCSRCTAPCRSRAQRAGRVPRRVR